jgi:shikimate kinase
MDDTTRIYLIGPMGVGKTSIGRQVATQIGWAFLDTDQDLCERTGADIGLIFEKEGEAGFRRRESGVLAAAAERSRLVIATGGGAVLSPDNRELMRQSGYIVHLTSSLSSQLERTRRGKHRPALEGDDASQVLKALRETREPLYQEIAHHTLQTDRRNPRAVASGLCEHLRSEGIC